MLDMSSLKKKKRGKLFQMPCFKFWLVLCLSLSVKAKKVTCKFSKKKMLSKKERKKPIRKVNIQPIEEVCALFMTMQVPLQDFLDSETVVHLPNSPYLPDLSPCDFFQLTSLKSNLCLRVFLYSAIFQCLQGEPQKIYLSTFRAWILRQETAFLLRENTLTG